jgi:hypothetical protein
MGMTFRACRTSSEIYFACCLKTRSALEPKTDDHLRHGGLPQELGFAGEYWRVQGTVRKHQDIHITVNWHARSSPCHYFVYHGYQRCWCQASTLYAYMVKRQRSEGSSVQDEKQCMPYRTGPNCWKLPA